MYPILRNQPNSKSELHKHRVNRQALDRQKFPYKHNN